jgi:hypothetical protein
VTQPLRGSLWTEIGLSLALSTLAVLVLDAGVYLLATRAARQGAAEDLAEQSAEVLGAQLAATPRAGWPAVFEVHRRGALAAAVAWDAGGQVLAGGGIALPSDARAVLANRTAQTHDETGAIVAIAPIGVERALVGVRVPIGAAGPPAWLLLGLHGLGAAGVLAAFGGALLRRRVVRPVEELRAATARIAARYWVTVSGGGAASRSMGAGRIRKAGRAPSAVARAARARRLRR